MGLGWFKRKLEITQIESATVDIKRFIAGLQGADADEVGVILGMATLMRIRCYYDEFFPYGIFGESGDQTFAELANKRMELRPRLNGTIREMQKLGDTMSASGMMVWLHTFRAMTMPEIRALGRQMWAELRRGEPYARQFLEGLALQGIDVPVRALTDNAFVPPFLAPERS